jgi:predicted glycosyltransferase
MAYLLPAYFEPDPEVLSKYGLKQGDTYFIVRLVSWGATHDWGQSGIADLPGLVRHLEKYGKVLLSVETELESEYQDYTLAISPEDMHSMLAYARAYVGEGATMASEGASLGTPSIYLNSQVLGYINDQMAAGLVYHIVPSERMGEQILSAIDGIMAVPPEHFRERSRQYVGNRIDVVGFILKEMVRLTKLRYKLRM